MPGTEGEEAIGIGLAEYDGGTVRKTTVAHNTISGATEDGVVVVGLTSSDGMGNPPLEELTSMGPSDNLIEDDLVTNSGENGIDLRSPGNVVRRNHTDSNAAWGIFAIEGTIDGGGNRAHGNGQPAQCSGVVCE